MPGEYSELSYWQVGLSALLILINASISLALHLQLEWRLLVASTRMTIQLLLVGLVLHGVFTLNQWYAVVALGLLMTLIAGGAAVQRVEHRYAGIWWNSVISVWASSWLVSSLALLAIIQVKPWYQPRYAIPLLGMILGNTLNGISLGLDRFGSELENRRDQVEMQLALGANSWEAGRKAVAEALRTGLVPMLNSMTIAGIVSLPGMMTGQLLAGVHPFQAVKYQLVIMFLIASATALGTLGVVLLSYLRMFTNQHQLRPLQKRKRT